MGELTEIGSPGPCDCCGRTSGGKRVAGLCRLCDLSARQQSEHLDGHHDVLSIEMKNEGDVLRVTLNDNVEDGSFLAEELIKKGFRVKMLKEEEVDLEDVFLSITKGVTN